MGVAAHRGAADHGCRLAADQSDCNPRTMLRLTLPDGPLRAEGRIVRADDYSASIEAEEIVARARNQAKVIEEEAQKSFESEKAGL